MMMTRTLATSETMATIGAAIRAFRALEQGGEFLRAATDATRKLAVGAAFDRAMFAALPRAELAPWSLHIQSQVLPALSGLVRESRRDWAVLPVIDTSTFSFTWIERRRDRAKAKLAVVAPPTGDARLPAVVVGVVVECGFCGKEMVESDSLRSFVGPRLEVGVRVAPICLPCRRRAEQSPNYEGEAWARLSSRTLRLVPCVREGERWGDGKPRGILQLVRSDCRSK